MTDVRKILVPVDLSSRSIGAARYATSLSREFNSELVFVHALQNGWPLGDAARGVRDVITGLQVTANAGFIIREGSPAAVILDSARTENVDLILMPTRGVPVLFRLFDGSITAHVLRAAHCPVWAGVDDLSSHSRRAH